MRSSIRGNAEGEREAALERLVSAFCATCTVPRSHKQRFYLLLQLVVIHALAVANSLVRLANAVRRFESTRTTRLALYHECASRVRILAPAAGSTKISRGSSFRGAPLGSPLWKASTHVSGGIDTAGNLTLRYGALLIGERRAWSTLMGRTRPGVSHGLP